MSPNRRLRRAFPVFLLLTALVLAGLPARAQSARRPLIPTWKVAVLGEGAFAWVRNLLASLWERGTTKEGMSIDPDGAPAAPNDEGTSIDPNGRP